jgi:aryl-alcohol dehydrogenase-like predicted oxidoreductase
MRKARLGTLEVARIGLGAMGMSHGYTGAGSDDDESIRTIHRALDLGVTLIDTAEIYGVLAVDPRSGAGENFQRNLALADEVQAVAAEVGATPAQVALAWLLTKGDGVVLSADQLDRLDRLPPAAGGHHNEAQMEMIER